MEDKNEAFSYTYSAKQQDEIKRICQKYAPEENKLDKLNKLRRLDETADRPGKLTALTIGVISTMIFGIGMCFTMVWTKYFTAGVLIGVLGLIGICIAYPIYSAMARRQRKKLAPEIIRLGQELMEGKQN